VIQHEVIACEDFKSPSISGVSVCKEFEQLAECCVPQQDNGFDCSLFVLEYITLLSTERVNMKDVVSSKAAKWFDQKLVTHRRHTLISMFRLMRDTPGWEEDSKKARQLCEMIRSSPGKT